MDADRYTPARNLLSGLSNMEARAYAMKALRAWKQEHWERREISLHGDLGREVLELIRREKGVPLDVQSQKEAFLEGQRLPFMAPFLEFVWWLVRAGYAVPGDVDTHRSGELVTLILTEAGQKLLRRPDEDHPLLPGFIRRLLERTNRSGNRFPLQVANYFGDAQDCYEHGLRRPAVTSLGVAYEALLQEIAEDFEKRGQPDLKGLTKAGERIARLRTKVMLLDQSAEEQRRALSALDFADQLRERRNKLVHANVGTAEVDDAEIEELLAIGGRFLEILWQLTEKEFR